MLIRGLDEIRTSHNVRGFHSAAHATGFCSAQVYPTWEATRIARAEGSRRRWVERKARLNGQLCGLQPMRRG